MRWKRFALPNPKKGEISVKPNDLSNAARVILKGHLATVENHLLNGIIPFWFERALDTQYGGFHD